MTPTSSSLLLALTVWCGTAFGFDRTWTEPTGELTCRVWSLPRRQTAVQHRAFVCVSQATGAMIGAGLRRDGSVRCALTGTVAHGCIYLRGCGYDEVTCE